MRSILSIIVIVFSLCALAGGFLSGSAAVPRISLATPAPNASGLPMPQTDETALDDFTDDPVAVADAPHGRIDADSQLAVVIVDCGHSPALEAPFVQLGVPVSIVVDPNAAAAHTIANLAADAGDDVYLQASPPLDPSDIAQMNGAFSNARGIAMRSDSAPSPSVLRALREVRLRFFDEYADDDAAAAAVRRAGVRYAGRTITVDDHLQAGYVRFMLEQAVRFGRGRPTVVMARPFPSTLDALRRLVAESASQSVRFVRLP